MLDTEGTAMIQMMDSACPPRLRRLTRAIGSVVDDYMLVSFTMMDQSDESSIDRVLMHVDHCMQYGEDLEPKDVQDSEAYMEGEGGQGGGEFMDSWGS